MLTRRSFFAAAGGGVAAGVVAARTIQTTRGGDSLLRVRPRKSTGAIGPGQHPLGLGKGRDGILVVPRSYSPDRPAPLALMLHGAGGRADWLAARLSLADSFGIVLLVPDSRGSTWDAIRGPFGPDVEFVNRAFERMTGRDAAVLLRRSPT